MTKCCDMNSIKSVMEREYVNSLTFVYHSIVWCVYRYVVCDVRISVCLRMFVGQDTNNTRAHITIVKEANTIYDFFMLLFCLWVLFAW